ncbi:TetR/AcrR family transcriptional regulator [Eubacteriaceae bacterium ES2]|nr:TetR/AcrR family transcriptional regulator [Eubacteriaceae bacterium ES2]
MEKSLVHRRESIIVSTIEVLNRVGLQNLSTKLIARQEGVSEGTLFRHFDNKTQILAAVIDQFGKFDNAIIETCAQKDLSPVDSLRYFFSAYAEYYENYPEITVVMQLYDSLLNEAGLADKIRAIIKKREDFIVAMIKDGQNSGIFSKRLNANRIAELLIGGNKEVCLKWRMGKYDFSLKERALDLFETLITVLER